MEYKNFFYGKGSGQKRLENTMEDKKLLKHTSKNMIGKYIGGFSVT